MCYTCQVEIPNDSSFFLLVTNSTTIYISISHTQNTTHEVDIRWQDKFASFQLATFQVDHLDTRKMLHTGYMITKRKFYKKKQSISNMFRL